MISNTHLLYFIVLIVSNSGNVIKENGSGVDEVPESIKSSVVSETLTESKNTIIYIQEDNSSFTGTVFKMIGIFVFLVILCLCCSCSFELCGVCTCLACFRPMLKRFLVKVGADEYELDNMEFFNGVDNRAFDGIRSVVSTLTK